MMEDTPPAPLQAGMYQQLISYLLMSIILKFDTFLHNMFFQLLSRLYLFTVYFYEFTSVRK